MQETKSIQVPRFFTQPDRDPLEEVAWRQAQVPGRDGEVPFEVPASWGDTAAMIAASKYAVPKEPGSREASLRDIVWRITKTLRHAGEQQGCLAGDAAEAFEAELAHLLLHQRFAFNSPVWFNLGRHHVYAQRSETSNHALVDGRIKEVDAYVRPQLSACFIQGIEDTIDGPGGVMDLMRSEARLFKFGSGTGTNFSNVRGAGEPISGGGQSSGLLSFLKVFDANAGSIKSGGTTRRAAKLVVVDDDHPEVVEFARWKAEEERKARALIAAGYDADFEGDAYATVSGQNSNNSIRLTDAFLKAVDEDAEWVLRRRTDGQAHRTIRARELWTAIVDSAWECADPGVFFDAALQKWHTSKTDGQIRTANPCGELTFVDGSACNLGSINLLAFHDEQGRLDTEALLHVVDLAILAMDIIVSFASYPTRRLAQGAQRHRLLGLGYANVGALLMLKGLSYGSPEARGYMAALTSLITARAYQRSSELAEAFGAFPGHADNKDCMAEVMDLHAAAAERLATTGSPIKGLAGPEVFDHGSDVVAALALEHWRRVQEAARSRGFRNAQVTVIAPTGTIGLLMGCSTTGIEPAFSLRAYKRLAGGGGILLTIPEVDSALACLGYDAGTRQAILAHVEKRGSIRGAPGLQKRHEAVFATAVDPEGNTLSWRAHLEMTAAVQPFLSGGVSKTINLPASATREDVAEAFRYAHRLGMKNTSLYRDGCKGSQPLNHERPEPHEASEDQAHALLARFPELAWGHKRAIPAKADHAENLHYTVNGLDVHLTLTWERTRDGRLRMTQVFLNVGEQGEHIYEHARDLAIGWSRALRLGETPAGIAAKCINAQGRGGGLTDHPLIKSCTSLKDFVWKLIMLEAYGKTDFVHPDVLDLYRQSLDRAPFIHERLASLQPAREERRDRAITEFLADDGDLVTSRVRGERCPTCGAGEEAIIATGSCRTCLSCGSSIGGC